jgi:hypothetical protein
VWALTSIDQNRRRLTNHTGAPVESVSVKITETQDIVARTQRLEDGGYLVFEVRPMTKLVVLWTELQSNHTRIQLL